MGNLADILRVLVVQGEALLIELSTEAGPYPEGAHDQAVNAGRVGARCRRLLAEPPGTELDAGRLAEIEALLSRFDQLVVGALERAVGDGAEEAERVVSQVVPANLTGIVARARQLH